MRRVLLIVLCLIVVGTAKCHAQQKNAVKVTFLSWITGSTKLSYERAFPAVKQSGEFCTSLISAGYDKFKNDPMGFTLRYSHKFFVAGYDPSKPLMGFYLRPELIYSHYNYTHSATALRTPVRMGALLGTFGYQYCYKHFIADAWVGAGYSAGKTSETGYYHGFKTWNLFGKNIDNLAMSFSIRLGVVW